MPEAQPAESRLIVTRDGPTLIMTLSNPSMRNALGPNVYEAMMDVFLQQVPRDAGIRALVLTGEGGMFCGGGNLTRLRENQYAPKEVQAKSIDKLHTAVRAMRACQLPVIAAVEGHAAGAGFSLALNCDMIVAAEDAKFTMSYVKVGLTPDGGGSYSLTKLLPRQMAAEFMMLGDVIPATRLHSVGVVNSIVPKGASLDAAMSIAERLADGASGAQGRVKRLIALAEGQQMQQHLDWEKEAFVESLHSLEAKEGIAAFLGKRTPNFPRG